MRVEPAACRNQEALLRGSRVVLLFAVLIGLASSQFVRAAEPVNLVANGDFSQVRDGRPVRWQAAGNAHVTQRLDAFSEGGNPCAKLTCTRWEPGGGSSHAMLAQVGVVKLEKGKYYEFSCRARAEGILSRRVRVAIKDTSEWHECGLSTGLRLTSAWQVYRRTFQATSTVDGASRLQFWFTEPGTFYVDDVRLVETAVQRLEFTDVVPATASRNLLGNGSFEVGAAGWASLGTRTGWGNLTGLHGSIQATGGTHGGSFLRIPLGGNQTPELYYDYFKPVARKELQPLAASLGWMPVEKGAPCTISCDMRASEEGVPAILGVRCDDPAEPPADHRQSVRLSAAWKRYSFTFRPAHGYVFATIGPSLKEDRTVFVDIDAVQLEKGEHATAFESRTPLEIGIEPSQPHGVFIRGEPATIRLHLCNHGETPTDANVQFAATDFFDRPTSLPALSLNVPAGSAVEMAISLPADWRGYYRLRARCTSDDAVQSRVLRIAIVPPRRGEDTILGINHAFAAAELIDLAKKAGVSWYRDWTLKWQDIEPAPGDYRWQVGDTQIDRVLREGVQLVCLLPPFPSSYWSTESPATRPAQSYPAVRLPMAAAPKDPRLLGEYVETTAAHFKDRIHVWEFLNEPVFTSYSLPARLIEPCPGKQYTPADYVRLLEVAAAAVRRGDPDGKVIGGIAGPPTRYTREVIEAGCLKFVDIFNLHAYPGGARPEVFIPEMDVLLELMDEHGGRKPIWFTEFSYFASDDPPCRPFLESQWSWATLLDSERQCAEYIIRFFTIMLAHNVQKVFLHAGTNTGPNEWAFNCCLLGSGGSPRKVFPALAVFTDLMGPAPRFVGGKTFGPTAFCYAFETNGRSVLVYWTTGDDAGHHRKLPQIGLERLDMMGNVVAAVQEVSPASAPSETAGPFYIVGPPGQAERLLAELARSSP
jgi:hypothetical protein